MTKTTLKKTFILGLLFQGHKSPSWRGSIAVRSRHVGWSSRWGLTSQTGSIENKLENVRVFWTLKAHPQGHISSSKASSSSPNTHQLVQIFKCLRLMEMSHLSHHKHIFIVKIRYEGACNLRTWEAEKEGLWSCGDSGLLSKQTNEQTKKYW